MEEHSYEVGSSQYDEEIYNGSSHYKPNDDMFYLSEMNHSEHEPPVLPKRPGHSAVHQTPLQRQSSTSEIARDKKWKQIAISSIIINVVALIPALISTTILAVRIQNNQTCKHSTEETHSSNMTDSLENSPEINTTFGQQFAFHVSMSAEISSGLSILAYDSVSINLNNAFNISESRYVVPVDGLYLTYLTASIPANVTTDIRLIGSPYTPNILISEQINCDYTSALREDMQFFYKNTNLWISSDNALYSNNITFPTSFGGFHLASLLEPLKAFAVRLTRSHNKLGPIPFNYLAFQTSELWKLERYSFVAPQGGIYYFSLSVASLAGYPLTVSVRTNNNPIIKLYYDNTNSNVIETLSQSSLMRLNKGAAVFVELENGAVYSDIRYQTSFFGFLYEPKLTKVVWSLLLTAKNFEHTDPLNFDTVLVNEGNGWNDLTRTYEVSQNGYYFINFGAISSYIITLNMQLLLNDKVIAQIYRGPINGNNGMDTRGKDLILYLKKNDVLRIRLLSGFYIFSDKNIRLFSFKGFRLF